jgi:hypothetical protein
MSVEKSVATRDALVAATKDKNLQQIAISGHLVNVPSIRLSPGQSLLGTDQTATISFADGVDGVQFSSDNQINGLRLWLVQPSEPFSMTQLLTVWAGLNCAI